MKIIQQDMLTLKEGILFHQVNCQGVMGGGIAASFARKWPELERDYREFCYDYAEHSHRMLGKVKLFPIKANLKIANVFGQDNVSSSARMTSYDATAIAFERIAKHRMRNRTSSFNRLQLYFPYGMGCGLGGGDWKIYSSIIETYIPDAIICKHNVD